MSCSAPAQTFTVPEPPNDQVELQASQIRALAVVACSLNSARDLAPLPHPQPLDNHRRHRPRADVDRAFIGHVIRRMRKAIPAARSVRDAEKEKDTGDLFLK